MVGDLLEDVGVVGVEFGCIVEEVCKVVDLFDGGLLCECIFVLQCLSILVYIIDVEMFVVFVLVLDGNFGKVCYFLCRYVFVICEEL